METGGGRKSRPALALALAAALATILLWLGSLRQPSSAEPAEAHAATAAPSKAAPPRIPTPALPAKPRSVRAPTPAAPAPPADAPPEREDPIVGIGPPGSGMALFPPPGTEPLRSGILVPDDFPLPEGYVRHYQATDDGKSLPAILMFHPDYEWVNEKGELIEVPADRIVPPELAPPGLPIRMLELPEAGGGADASP